MDNWRTRAFNKLLFRIMRQRMARCETTQEMRELIASIDSYGALFSSPKSLTIYCIFMVEDSALPVQKPIPLF